MHWYTHMSVDHTLAGAIAPLSCVHVQGTHSSTKHTLAGAGPAIAALSLTCYECVHQRRRGRSGLYPFERVFNNQLSSLDIHIAMSCHVTDNATMEGLVPAIV
jgi:hypothetical protein